MNLRGIGGVGPPVHVISRPRTPILDANRVITTAKRGGRGGIRTHGGLPHARFRVECLKPDSATLPALELSMVKGAALCNDDGFCAGESE